MEALAWSCAAAGALVAESMLFFALHARGVRAVARLDADERALLARLLRIDAAMGEDGVAVVIGRPPDRGAGGPRPTWRAPDGRSRVAVYLQAGRVRKVRWMKSWVFVLEWSPARGRPEWAP